ncbi:aldo/keto reductase [bacterium]|nr:MAG: aldo/keto reductase [bacterium]
MQVRYVNIPKTNLNVSIICFGTGEIGSSLDRETSFGLFDCYMEQGGNFFDTAHNYGDWVPNIERNISEKTLGAWMKERKNRERVVIATKGGHADLDKEKVGRNSRKELQKDIDESLLALQIDTIDLYYTHKDYPEFSVDEIIETLNDAVKTGKIRHFAAANMKVNRLRAAQDYARVKGLIGFSADQMFWNAGVLEDFPFHAPTLSWMDEGLYTFHLETGMAAIPYQSVAFGIFHYLHNHNLDEMNPYFRGFYNLSETEKRYQRIVEVMQETGLSITKVVLGYLISRPFVTIPIIGVRNSFEQLIDNCNAGEAKLPEELVNYIQIGTR